MHLSYIVPLLLAVQARSLSVLVPLYLYPDSSASAWSNVTAAIAANPYVNWQIIVNPNSGPGDYPPDANYIAGVSKINSYPNAVTLGYVDTGYTQVPYSTLKSQVDTWAKWSTYTAANIAIRGIFFDDVSNDASSMSYSYYQQAAAYAHSTLPLKPAPVVFNPGTTAPDQLFAFADTIIQYEGKLSDYRDTATISTFNQALNQQTAIVIHDTTTTTSVKTLVHNMAVKGIEAVYFGVDCCYHVFSKDLLNLVASAVYTG
ncbi:MAG: hypothetical protein LQ350_008432 [Teloschistes chrysophthalmus]|nr:MAG: hypothetical protein LQ350_008432 [Niorma chrysophthalma]